MPSKAPFKGDMGTLSAACKGDRGEQTQRLGRFCVLALFLVRATFGEGKGRAAARLRLALLRRAAGLLLLIARLAIGILRRLLRRILSLLGSRRGHNAVIMLRMLKIILGHHPVAGRIGIARQLEIFLVDMCRRAADFDFRSGRIKGAVGIVSPAAIAAATTAAAAIIVLRPAAASA